MLFCSDGCMLNTPAGREKHSMKTKTRTVETQNRVDL